ncbi:hypothetical protein [Mycolicibacterium septicum]|uniref:hypothetical protein n=1 Tax=Mycolicibacterium septicum TaxID=98668 RepID=UPI001AF0800F|nr:hypothetical protein [Mycolicibacterium septicum]QRY51753.1 hypothetical protein JVX95_31005 [Mycolicibacterium septicum]
MGKRYVIHVDDASVAAKAFTESVMKFGAGNVSVAEISAERMTVDDVRATVDAIIAVSDDPEAAHSGEDTLLADLVRQYCPAEIAAEVDRLAAADFERWRA